MRKIAKSIDLTNRCFGKLTVMSKDEVKNASLKEERKLGLRTNAPVHWLCQCDCGNITSVAYIKLSRGIITSCGCSRLKYDFEDKAMLGTRYGEWEIVEYLGKLKRDRDKIAPYFKCRCSCGSHKVVNAYNLLTGKSVSCGCIKSVGNQLIAKYLTEYNIVFEREKYFKHENGYGYFDFYIPHMNLVIEYDGEQHFEPVDFGNKGEKHARSVFEIVKQRDKNKEWYCNKNNIKMLRIPYWERNNIEKILENTLND